jgi:hypothetical protein
MINTAWMLTGNFENNVIPTAVSEHKFFFIVRAGRRDLAFLYFAAQGPSPLLGR